MSPRIDKILGSLPVSNLVSSYLIMKNRRSLVVKKIGNLTFFLNPSGSVDSELIRHGEYEGETSRVFSSILRGVMTVADIGANIGNFALLAASKIGSGIVHSFEPEPSNFFQLEMNCRINSFHNVQLHKKAVSDRNGTAKLYLHALNSGGHSLHRQTRASPSISISMVKLDSFELDFDVVKIDTEGNELRVLEGMKRTIERNRNLKIILEYNPTLLMRAGVKPDSLLEYIHHQGFSYVAINETGAKVAELDERTTSKMIEKGSNVNVLCERRVTESQNLRVGSFIR